MAGNEKRNTQVVEPTKEEIEAKTLEWIQAAKTGDELAKANLIDLYSWLIRDAVNYYQSRTQMGDHFADMFQDGVIGLLVAVNMYDPKHSSGASFSTYARYWVRDAVSRYVPRHSGHMKLPPVQYRQLSRILKLREEGYSTTEIADTLGITPEEVNILRQSKLPMRSIEGVDTDEARAALDELLADQDGDVEEIVINESLRGEMQRLISQLSPEIIAALASRYGTSGGHDRTLEAMVDVMNGITGEDWNKERVRQLVLRAEQQLARAAKREDHATNLSSVSMFASPARADAGNAITAKVDSKPAVKRPRGK